MRQCNKPFLGVSPGPGIQIDINLAGLLVSGGGYSISRMNL